MDAEVYFEISHPFHPRLGQRLALIVRRSIFGQNLVYYKDEKGHLCSIPMGWTDLREPDLFVEVSAGRSLFKPFDLIAVADQINRFNEERRESVKNQLK